MTSVLAQAYYAASAVDFLQAAPQTILGHLAQHHAHDLDPLQKLAWLRQIEILQREVKDLPDAWLAFEFAIPRMGKRADVVLILNGVIFVIEFKIGADHFDPAAIDQALDYALDLKNFHAGSHLRTLVPVVIATEAAIKPVQPALFPDGVAAPILSNGNGLGQWLRLESRRLSCPPLNLHDWLNSGYRPTPTIIEAAQALYSAHRVEDITRSDAGAKNLGVTTRRITQIIENAKSQGQKVICFVTGVPGAGKTLAGLNLVTQRTQAHADEHAVFLSGNGPLVDVLREALARDEASRARQAGQRLAIGEARREVKSFIQNIHHFRDANLRTKDAPIEHVVVFDEAQRAWNAGKISRFMREKHGIENFGQSEPEFLISVMDRHADWCAIVCLVGGGQEINDGEAGLTEWFAALRKTFSDWTIHSSDQLGHPAYNRGQNLSAMTLGLQYKPDDHLHLAVSIRSFRAEKLSDFVNELISGRASSAHAVYQNIRAVYPIWTTRDIATAREWLRFRARGSERYGLVASSGASRLKPDGLLVNQRLDAPNWFLNAKSDVRGSFYLEDPATEFDIQGLELDWVGVCWDADFRRSSGQWSYHNFQGTKWNNVNNPTLRTYLANAYRVLLTRARQGMILYIPKGNVDDPTRAPSFYNDIAAYLEECGIAPLADEEWRRGVLPAAIPF